MAPIIGLASGLAGFIVTFTARIEAERNLAGW
jgi:hypothetical protein